jgi:hypothetical protein
MCGGEKEKKEKMYLVASAETLCVRTYSEGPSGKPDVRECPDSSAAGATSAGKVPQWRICEEMGHRLLFESRWLNY